MRVLRYRRRSSIVGSIPTTTKRIRSFGSRANTDGIDNNSVPPSSPGSGASSGYRRYNPSGIQEWRKLLNEDESSRNGDDGSLRDTEENTRSVDLTQLYNPDLHLPSAPKDWEGYEPATPLTQELIARIAVTGRPISTADFMDIALLHPEHGYYTRGTSRRKETTSMENDDDDDFFDDDPIENSNKDADTTILRTDFLTSPEMTSLFGETVGVWFWTWLQQQHNHHEPFQLLECGPGTGQLMADLLRVSFLHQPPQAIHLIEQSPAMRKQQRKTLESMVSPVPILFPYHFSDVTPETKGVRVYWHASIADYRAWSTKAHVTTAPRTLVVAHEFIDALPVYSFEKTADGTFRERLVDVAVREDVEKQWLLQDETEKTGAITDEQSPSNDISGESKHAKQQSQPPENPDSLKPRFRIVLAPEVTLPLKTLLPVDSEGRLQYNDGSDDSSVGSIIEVCPQGILFAQDVAQIVAETNGAGLIIDYGAALGSQDSLRGYSRHEQTNFLSRPGEIDITADVDFGAIKHAVMNSHHNNVTAYGPMEQGEFLVSMGLESRVVSILEKDSTTDEEAEKLCRVYERLLDHKEMGSRYKVLAIVPQSDTPPPPFDVLDNPNLVSRSKTVEVASDESI